ncbi:MAG TPA: hypothetical protein VGF40_00290, partial [Thermoanaerobaculia bacterium]
MDSRERIETVEGVIRYSFFVLRSSFFVLRSSFFVLRSSLFVLRSSSFVRRRRSGPTIDSPALQGGGITAAKQTRAAQRRRNLSPLR